MYMLIGRLCFDSNSAGTCSFQKRCGQNGRHCHTTCSVAKSRRTAQHQKCLHGPMPTTAAASSRPLCGETTFDSLIPSFLSHSFSSLLYVSIHCPSTITLDDLPLCHKLMSVANVSFSLIWYAHVSCLLKHLILSFATNFA